MNWNLLLALQRLANNRMSSIHENVLRALERVASVKNKLHSAKLRITNLNDDLLGCIEIFMG